MSTTDPLAQASDPEVLTVLYNGDCPVCSAEMAHYKSAAEKSGAPLVFTDLTKDPKALEEAGLSEDAAARSLHVRLPDGRLVKGTESFAKIWDHLPNHGWMARGLRLYGIRHIVSSAYDYLVAPVIYRMFYRRLKAKAARQAQKQT